MPTNVANLFPTVSTPRRLSFADPESNVDGKTYSSTSLWGKHKMTYAELEMAWKEYNEMEEKSAISYATSEYVDKILSERLKSSDIVLFDLNGWQKPKYNSNERQGTSSTDEVGYTSNEWSSSVYAEFCTSEETIRPSRLRRRSRTLEESVPPPKRSAPLFPSFEHESATIKPLTRFPSTRPRLHLPSLTRLSVPLQRTKRLDEKDGELHHNESNTEEEPQHSDGLVGGPMRQDLVLEIPERPPSRLGFFHDNYDDDD